MYIRNFSGAQCFKDETSDKLEWETMSFWRNYHHWTKRGRSRSENYFTYYVVCVSVCLFWRVLDCFHVYVEASCWRSNCVVSVSVQPLKNLRNKCFSDVGFSQFSWILHKDWIFISWFRGKLNLYGVVN